MITDRAHTVRRRHTLVDEVCRARARSRTLISRNWVDLSASAHEAAALQVRGHHHTHAIPRRAHPVHPARHPLISPLRVCRRSAGEFGFLLIHRRPSWSATEDRAGALPTHTRAARALAMHGPPRASTPHAPRPIRTTVDSRGRVTAAQAARC